SGAYVMRKPKEKPTTTITSRMTPATISGNHLVFLNCFNFFISLSFRFVFSLLSISVLLSLFIIFPHSSISAKVYLSNLPGIEFHSHFVVSYQTQEQPKTQI